MKKCIKQLKKKALAVLMAVMAASVFMPAISVQAAEPWRDAYAEFLRNITEQDYYMDENLTQFRLSDMDDNGIPELIVFSIYLHGCYIYEYSNTVSFLSELGGGNQYRAFISANPNVPGVFTYEYTGTGEQYFYHYYTLKNSQLIETRITSGAWDGGQMIEEIATSGLLYDEATRTTIQEPGEGLYEITEANIQRIIYGWSSPTATTPAPTQNNAITVTINGTPIHFTGQAPVNVNGRVLVPVRGVFETLGFNVSWNEQARQATLSKATDTIVITLDSTTFTTNGIRHTLDVPAQSIGGRTMLPIRNLLESVGYGLSWSEATRTVVITTN